MLYPAEEMLVLGWGPELIKLLEFGAPLFAFLNACGWLELILAFKPFILFGSFVTMSLVWRMAMTFLPTIELFERCATLFDQD